MAQHDTPRKVHRAAGSGRWFPGDRAELQSAVDGYLARADVPAMTGRIVAALAPHAGYVYSGPVAGYTFRALQEDAAAHGSPDTVVVLGFSHRSGFSGVAFMDGDALQTPLGDAVLDGEAVGLLAGGSKRIYTDSAAHAGEHSAENQVPFVQVALPEAALAIGLMGDHDPVTVDDLVAALVSLAERKTIVVVASTDLLHDPDYDRVTATDGETLYTIGALDHEGLLASWSYSRQVCCGIGPVVTAMRVAEARGCPAAEVLCYRNSGDDHPESRGNWVVGYGAVVMAAP
jgi:AmmeMemoRadiSam system protein B